MNKRKNMENSMEIPSKSQKPNKRKLNMAMDEPEIWKEVLSHLDQGVHESAFIKLLKKGIDAKTKAAHVCKLTEELNQRIPFLSDDVSFIAKNTMISIIDLRKLLQATVRRTRAKWVTSNVTELHIYGVMCATMNIWENVKKIVLRGGKSVAAATFNNMHSTYNAPDMPVGYCVAGIDKVRGALSGEFLFESASLSQFSSENNMFPVEFFTLGIPSGEDGDWLRESDRLGGKVVGGITDLLTQAKDIVKDKIPTWVSDYYPKIVRGMVDKTSPVLSKLLFSGVDSHARFEKLEMIETYCNIVEPGTHNWEDHHYYVAPVLSMRALYLPKVFQVKLPKLFQKFQLESRHRIKDEWEETLEAIANWGGVALCCVASFVLLYQSRLLVTFGKVATICQSGSNGYWAVEKISPYALNAVVPLAVGATIRVAPGSDTWTGLVIGAMAGLAQLIPAVGEAILTRMIVAYTLPTGYQLSIPTEIENGPHDTWLTWLKWTANLTGIHHYIWQTTIRATTTLVDYAYNWGPWAKIVVSKGMSFTQTVGEKTAQVIITVPTEVGTVIIAATTLVVVGLLYWKGKDMVKGILKGGKMALWWMFRHVVTLYNEFTADNMIKIPTLKRLHVHHPKKTTNWLTEDRYHSNNWTTTVLCGDHSIEELKISKVVLAQLSKVYLNERAAKILGNIKNIKLAECESKGQDYMIFADIDELELDNTEIEAESFDTTFSKVQYLSLKNFTLHNGLKGREQGERLEWYVILPKMKTLLSLRLENLDFSGADWGVAFKTAKRGIEGYEVSIDHPMEQLVANISKYVGSINNVIYLRLTNDVSPFLVEFSKRMDSTLVLDKVFVDNQYSMTITNVLNRKKTQLRYPFKPIEFDK